MASIDTQKTKTSNSEDWGDFWSRSAIDACTAQFPDDARKTIADHWRGIFAALPDGISILDVATGRGAVLHLAQNTLPSLNGVSMLGVDQAEIETAALPAGDAAPIVIKGGIDAADLPLPDGAFDLVTSQFGLEYADFHRALGECIRVCRGRFVALVHAADGIVVRQNGAQSGQIGWLMGEIGFTRLLKDHFAAPSRTSAGHMDHALTAIRERARTEENPGMLAKLYNDALELQNLAARYPVAEILNMIDGMEYRMAAHAMRMRALADAGRDANEMQAAAALLEAAGFAAPSLAPERTQSGHLVGWWIDAARTAP
ncbi:class I SAM-dependent methyltransferase [Eilatimonas milleporae]|uniref:Methyltransferase family protein n=1 Tax=Eilatimonas milleporae TaxID=911205 RepID=A0A3M0CX57_9PROT|nr:class I SAM-dependent methyltransferase [Eilatimonas milleporae]RMB12079.1 methyltransferase family protein [Eilatimonas milleporae]